MRRLPRKIRLAALLLFTCCLAGQAPAQTIPSGGRPLTPAQGRALDAEITTLSRQLGIRQSVIAAIARVLRVNLRNASFEDLVERVRSQANRAVELKVEIDSLQRKIASLTAPAVRTPAEQALARATAAFEEGRLDDAAREFAGLEALRRSDSEAAREAWLQAVEARALIAELRLAFDEAEALRFAAAREERRLSTERQWGLMMAAADSRFRQGDLLGDNAALERAIAIYREEVLPLAAADVRLAAGTQNALGMALSRLGERDGGTDHLDEAAAAYRSALEVGRRDVDPSFWAMVQGNLGVTLFRLGERQKGPERLEQSVAALRGALEVFTPDETAAAWATVQNNLGAALLALALRESGTARLEQAAEAHRAALKVQSPEQMPLDWAMTQNNLGNVLQSLGEREAGTASLEKAVEAYRAALGEWTRERVPLYWSMGHNNLGAVLIKIAERETGTKRLEEALAALRSAAEESTRARAPVQWAAVQHNMGDAHRIIGQRERDSNRLREAMSAYEAALEVRTRERAPLEWAATTLFLGFTKGLLSGEESDATGVTDAADSVREARATLAAAGHEPYTTIADSILAALEQITLSVRRDR